MLAWDEPVPLRYALEAPESGVPLALCAAVQGLFVDRPPQDRERYTLIGVEPAGLLRVAVTNPFDHSTKQHHALVDGLWLGNVRVSPVHSEPDAELDCFPYAAGCDCEALLLDVVVVGSRVSSAESGLIDVELDGVPWIDLDNVGGADAEPPQVTRLRLTDMDDRPLGTCRETIGVFWERPLPDLPAVTLIGCAPSPELALTLAGEGHRQSIQAAICAVSPQGRRLTASLSGGYVDAEVVAVRPSPMGERLVDVEFNGGSYAHTMPVGARQIWDLWFHGGPRRVDMWADCDRDLRGEWLAAAMSYAYHRGPDKPPGGTYHLDGRHITDIEGFYCALGEAFNGPGGYFGANLDALGDCLGGGYGAAPPFTIVWHDSRVASTHLVAGYDRRAFARAVTFDDLLLAMGGPAQVVLR